MKKQNIFTAFLIIQSCLFIFCSENQYNPSPFSTPFKITHYPTKCMPKECIWCNNVTGLSPFKEELSENSDQNPSTYVAGILCMSYEENSLYLLLEDSFSKYRLPTKKYDPNTSTPEEAAMQNLTDKLRRYSDLIRKKIDNSHKISYLLYDETSNDQTMQAKIFPVIPQQILYASGRMQWISLDHTQRERFHDSTKAFLDKHQEILLTCAKQITCAKQKKSSTNSPHRH